MPWSANDASRQAAQRRQQQQQQRQQRMSRNNQQFLAKQMKDLQSQSRSRARRSSPSEMPLDLGYLGEGESGRRSRWIRVALVVVCVGLAVAGGIYLGLRSGQANNGGGSGTGGVSGAVRSGSSWNLRAEPNARSQVVGRVQPGDQVIISCLAGNWAKLKAPQEGVFVSVRGLSYPEKPPNC